MRVLPPGNILQNIYIKNRVKKSNARYFLEIGSGNGYISNELLGLGLKGVGCDLNQSACANNEMLNAGYIRDGRYKVLHGDFNELALGEQYDVIISSMVIEHIPDEQLVEFIENCKKKLAPGGTIIFLVPSGMKYWGIEDEIAGHIKRYEFKDFADFKEKFGLRVSHIAGLTYPISNWLFKLSNRIIKKNESAQLQMTQLERTVYTGNRNVPYKTVFPGWMGIVLNEFMLYPLHLLQLMFTKNPNSLVIYCELKSDS